MKTILRISKKFLLATIMIMAFLPIYALFINTAIPSTVEHNKSPYNKLNILSSGFLAHNPLVILNDIAFGTCGCVSQGNGTSSNPYIIQNFNFTGISLSINITNTNSYFIFQNNLINNGNLPGINLFNVTNAIIENNSMSNAIEIGNSTDISLINNSLINLNGNGIQLSHDSKISIIDNTASNKYGDASGFGITNSVNCSISKNLVSSIDLVNVNNTNIENNVINSSFYFQMPTGMGLTNLQNVFIINNSFINCGPFYVGGLANFSLSGNNVNGKPILFLQNQKNFAITHAYEEIMLVNCSSISMSNQTISNTTMGIILVNCSSISISNQNISYSLTGIEVLNSQNITFYDNLVRNSVYGISASFLSNSYFVDNNLTFNEFGIYLTTNSSSNIFSNNTADHNFRSGFEVNSNNDVISNNTADNNEEFGFFSESNNTFFSNNEADYNDYGGFLIFDSFNDTFKNNLANNNTFSLPNFSYQTIGFFVDQFTSLTTFKNNTANFNDYGFELYSSSNNTFNNNVANFNRICGFSIQSNSDFNLIEDNIAQNNLKNYDNLGTGSNNILINNSFDNLIVKSTNTTIHTQNFSSTSSSTPFTTSHTNVTTSPFSGPGLLFIGVIFMLFRRRKLNT